MNMPVIVEKCTENLLRCISKWRADR